MDWRKENSLYHVFFQVIRLHYQRTQMLFDKIGVYPGQPPLLMILSNRNGLSQRELANMMKIKPATITVMLNRMEKSEFVERRPDLSDQRVSRVYLTEKGEELAGKVKEIMKTIDKECFDDFSEEEQALLRRLFMQMRDNLLRANGRKLED